VASVVPVAQAKLPVAEKQKPLLRGWFHLGGSVAMLAVGPLIGLEANGTKAEVCAAVACCAVWAMLTTSAVYHRVRWSDVARRRMRHADHSMIFVCIAGTYTAVAGLSLPDNDAWIVLGLVWGACVAGIVMRFVWLDAPKWAVALPYVAAGWIAVGAMPEFFHYLGVAGFSVMLSGGLLYTVGAVIYARRRPDPWPTVFGYHEVFHSCVVVAAALHLSLIAFIVLPALKP
jgi:hemolysin III